ncbi:hypothetical protein FHS96_000283 [Sphingomonas zeicaulis]|uniref:TIR domain-containing protein n=1 Tax=Sphingomonas zeicaulis TaxID=1632740 RepID=UPI003D26009C
MDATRAVIGTRYRAFLSYSHKDARFAARLHRRLETWRIPRAIVGQPTLLGPLPPTLTPIFRDREELPAAADLSEEVGRALTEASSLIILCSPAAAQSRWVRREIEMFRTVAPGRPILAALVPGADPSCLADLFGDGEPIAADFNPVGDGERYGLLKLVAGIAGVPLDALVRRDAQRRMRRVIAVTLLSVLLMLIFAAVAVVAVDAKRQASAERDRAEGLVEFMLTDLRGKLRGVGRLDVLGSVNDRAHAYYAAQDLEALPADSIERRARLLHLMGADEENAGHLDRAVSKWREAHRATAALLARAPDDKNRIFGHAQSEFWLGFAALKGKDPATARVYFEAYRRLARRLVAIEPENLTYRQEVAYADGNLCTVSQDDKNAAPQARVSICRSALALMQDVARRTAPAERDAVMIEVGNYHAWLAGALMMVGEFKEAEVQYLAQAKITDRLLAGDPRNMDLREIAVVTAFSVARIEAKTNRTTEARARLLDAQKAITAMRAFDPANATWAAHGKRVERLLSQLETKGTLE